MPDDFDQLTTRLMHGLTAVQWPEPGELRARARRRTIRTVVAAPLVVALVVTGTVWGVRAGSGDARSNEPAGGPTPSAVTTGPTTVPTRLPPWGGAEIPIDALLQPADVGPARHIENVYTWVPGTYGAWTFQQDRCLAFGGLKINAWRDFQFMRIHHVAPDPPEDVNNQNVYVEAERYPNATAAIVIDDVRRIVSACARYDGGESEAGPDTHSDITQTVLDEGFAGTESLLIRQRVDIRQNGTDRAIGDPLMTTYAVVRVNDLVTIISRNADDPAALRDLGRKAAARLCVAAEPRC
jgi:hypothetical protein